MVISFSRKGIQASGYIYYSILWLTKDINPYRLTTALPNSGYGTVSCIIVLPSTMHHNIFSKYMQTDYYYII